MSRILVTGGTGTLGRHVVPLLVNAGHDVRVLSRRARASAPGVTVVVGDLTTGVGLAPALADAEVVVHLAGGPTGDGATTRTLVRAVQDAGGPHLVVISVVGADRLPVRGLVDRAAFGYYDEKRQVEEAVTGSGLPWTLLRATQFHEFVVDTVRLMSRGPVAPYFAGVAFQPVAAREVGERMAGLAQGEPAGLVPDLGGPDVIPMRALVNDCLHAWGRRRAVVPLWMPGGAARALREGANLLLEGDVGRQTWAEFVADGIS